MPSLRFTLPAGTLTDEQYEAIASRITLPLLAIEGLPHEEPFLSWSWALVHEAKAFVNGKPSHGPLARIDAVTGKGLLDGPGKKNAFVKEITNAFVDIGQIPGQQVLVIIHESENLAFNGEIPTVQDAHETAAT